MDYDQLAEEITSWMRTYAAQAGAGGYVVGLSGGIDSAVTATLAVRAMGREHTLGVLLPCHSQAEDAEFARLAADSLGLDPLLVKLDEPYDRLLAALPDGTPMAKANVKPRLRMTALYYLAQSRGYLVAGTGNRAEIMVGYFTKYGDGGVDMEPLGMLYKREVRALARVLGVPEPIITRPPTAGLWAGQTDEGELGMSYDDLDAILAALDEGREPDADPRLVARVRRMVAAAAHKREMPPSFPVRR